MSLVFTMFSSQAVAATQDAIINTANKYLGIPYQFGGNTPNGFDCSGFIWYVFRENGVELPRTADEQFRLGQAVQKSELSKGDLVFFETYKPGPSHSGMYLGNGQFISATSSRGIAIASVNDPSYWGPRYLGARRVLQGQPEQVVLSVLPPGLYHDVSKDHWAYNEIKVLGEQKMINGFPNSMFYPENNLTRAQAAIIIGNVKGLTNETQTSNFSDVPSDFWAANAISAAVEAGYFIGFEDGTFKPDENLTREQVAVLFTRVFNIAEGEMVIPFNDLSESDWSYIAIQKLVSNGIAIGFADHTYRPKEAVNRAQFVVFLSRIMDK